MLTPVSSREFTDDHKEITALKPRALHTTAFSAIMAAICGAALAPTATAAASAPGDASAQDVIMRASVDELTRTMSELSIDDLPKPYFLQIRVTEREATRLTASYGGLVRADHERSRIIESRIHVGSYELDNTNFQQPFGYGGPLPLDDDYDAIRQAIWLVLDEDYKRAVQSLTAKQAYLKEKNVTDRPNDFAPGDAVTFVQPHRTFSFDEAVMTKTLKRISARFNDHPAIQDAEVSFIAGEATDWLINSEGSRLRTGDAGGLLQIDAELQADDGMRLFDSRTYLCESVDEIPPVEQLLKDVDALCEKLIAQTQADPLEQYTGPVLFEPKAAGAVFQALLADHVAAIAVPLGAQWRSPSFEKKLGLRLLPRSYQVYDDPRPKRLGYKLLAGAYDFDDEGVPASRVSIIEDGKLKHLVAARAPTRKVTRSTGHGRNGGFGDAHATIGCLYIRDEDGLATDELRQELLEEVRDEGLPYGLRVATMSDGDFTQLGVPIYAYKVYAEDGHEEPVRGLQFQTVSDRAMKHIIASGREPEVYNLVSNISVSIISPAVLFEELDLSRLKEEFDKLPILPAPSQRKP